MNNEKLIKLPKQVEEMKSQLESIVQDTNTKFSGVENKKLDKNGIVTMANMGQDVKEAMTGGSVAVVGKNTILTENIVNKQITPSKLSYLELDIRNIYDYNNIEKNSRLNDTGGTISDINTFTTDYIPVIANKYYKVGIFDGNKINYRICLYGKNKEFLSSILPTNTKTELEILVAQDGFIRCGFDNADLKKIYICDKDNFEGYYETMYALKENIITPSIQNNYIKNGKNLFNKDSITLGKLLAPSGNLVENSAYNVSDFIEIKKGKTYTINKPRNHGVFNLKKRIVEFIDSDSNFTSKTFTAKFDGYLRVSVNNSVLDVMQVENSITETAYEKYCIEIPYLKNNSTNNNPLFNKTLLNFGDSIACGTALNPSYATQIAQNNFMTFFNRAVGGATVREIDGNTNNIINQINGFTENVNVDYILINGLTNDVNAISGNPTELMGEMVRFADNYTTYQYNTKTFCGALEQIFNLLTTKFLNAKIIYICTHRMHTRAFPYQESVQEAARKICNKWSIPYVDIFNEGGYNSCIPSLKSLYGAENGTDGTHINKNGYSTFYVPRIENKMKNI